MTSGVKSVHDTTAVACGPYSPRDISIQPRAVNSVLFVFNLGLWNWIKNERLPSFWWITEKKVLRECEALVKAASHNGPDSDHMRVLLPLQLRGCSDTSASLSCEFIDLSPLTHPNDRNALSLQSAALWWIATQGFSSVHCIGFDHLFRNADSGFFKPQLLPRLPGLLSGAHRDGNVLDEFTDVLFHRRDLIATTIQSTPRRRSAHLHAELVFPRYHAEPLENETCAAGRAPSLKKGKPHIDQGPLVSVLICVKDAALTIRDSLQSIARQTYQNLEVIVVDGNSQDGTREAIQEFGNMIDTFLSEPDEGYYDALNKALELACGDFLIVVNGDDVLLPQAIERLVQAAVTNGSDIAAAHARTVDAAGRFTGDLPSFWNPCAALRCPLRHGAMLASRQIYDRVGPYDSTTKVVADWTWMHKALSLGASVTIVDEHLLNFRTTGVSSGTNPVHVSEVDHCLQELEPTLPKVTRKTLHSPWETGADNLIALCREFPLAGRLRQALLAARMAQGSGKVWPAITVAVPLDGSPARLEGFLENLLRQNFSNYEVLFCGSHTEAEEQLLRQSAHKDLRIHFIPAATNNWLRTALLQAAGDYLLLPTAESVVNPSFLEALHQEAQNTGALLLADAGSDRRKVVRCKSGSVLYEDGWLPDFFLAQPAIVSMAGIFIAREVYKPAIDWIAFSKQRGPLEACALSIFVTAAFSLFATKVNTLNIDTVRRRNRALGEALVLCDTDRCSLPQKDPELAEKLMSAASRIFTETVVHNHRLGKNSRLRLVSDWNKALRETLNVRGQQTSPQEPEQT